MGEDGDQPRIADVLGPLTPSRSARAARPRRKEWHEMFTPARRRSRSITNLTPSLVSAPFFPNHSASVSAPVGQVALFVIQRINACAVRLSKGTLRLRPVFDFRTTSVHESKSMSESLSAASSDRRSPQDQNTETMAASRQAVAVRKGEHAFISAS
jgi:hypothetical protein